MGMTLPKPVMTKIQERYGNGIFRCGMSCVNGYRDSMEDAHIAHLADNWGFFGVFDGHVNDHCSAYLAEAWEKQLAEKDLKMPWSDERMKEIALAIDKEFMTTGDEGGSTGTFFLATKTGAATIHLQVGNVGDSRVLVCKAGEGLAMTEDHKPNNEVERTRIEQCGGRVENNRVDGSLAVSRAFGDREYKQGGADQLRQKVIALADVTHVDLTLGRGDFAVLCCDGVFESNFSNEEVIDFIKAELAKGNDLAVISSAVCEEAIARGSRDNISCVIVQFADGSDYAEGAAQHGVEIVPGPFNVPRHSTFRRAYASMAVKGGLTVASVLEKRFDMLTAAVAPGAAAAVVAAAAASVADAREELDVFREGPPPALRGAERTAWFERFFDEVAGGAGGGGAGGAGGDARSEQLQRIQMLQQQMGVPFPILLSLMNGGLGGAGAAGDDE